MPKSFSCEVFRLVPLAHKQERRGTCLCFSRLWRFRKPNWRTLEPLPCYPECLGVMVCLCLFLSLSLYLYLYVLSWVLGGRSWRWRVLLNSQPPCVFVFLFISVFVFVFVCVILSAWGSFVVVESLAQLTASSCLSESLATASRSHAGLQRGGQQWMWYILFYILW